MGKHSVRLDSETEAVLEELVRATGLSISGVFRQGLFALRDARGSISRPTRRAFEIYQEMDLGPGGHAIAASTETRRAVSEAIRRKHKR